MKPKVYIAGPYTKGNIMNNINQAVWIGNQLLDMGFIPFIPHLTGFWDLIISHDYETWMEYDLEWLKECDAVLRISGESIGADREVEIAKDMGMLIFYQDDVNAIDKLIAYLLEKK
jgi:hypothetical protein